MQYFFSLKYLHVTDHSTLSLSRVNGLETSVRYYERNPFRYKEGKETEDWKETRSNLDPDITPYTSNFHHKVRAVFEPKAQINSNKIAHDKRIKTT